MTNPGLLVRHSAAKPDAVARFQRAPGRPAVSPTSDCTRAYLTLLMEKINMRILQKLCCEVYKNYMLRRLVND